MQSGDNESGFLGSLRPQLVLEVTEVSPKFSETRTHKCLLILLPLLLWSTLAVLPIQLLTPKVHSKQACVSFEHFTKRRGKCPLSYHVSVLMEELDKIIVQKNTGVLNLLFNIWTL